MKLLELLTQTNGVSGNEEAVCDFKKTLESAFRKVNE